MSMLKEKARHHSISLEFPRVLSKVGGGTSPPKYWWTGYIVVSVLELVIVCSVGSSAFIIQIILV